MRLLIFSILILSILSCRSDAGNVLRVDTTTKIKLPSEALFANFKSFAGLEETVPDLFVTVSVDHSEGALRRTITLPDDHFLRDSLVLVDETNHIVEYRTVASSWSDLPIDHVITVQALPDGVSSVHWSSSVVEDKKEHRTLIKTRLEGIQESYLTALAILGEELENMIEGID